MDTKLATTQIRLQQWAAIIKDRCESGLKVDEYCELHQLSHNAYYYWLRKIREAALTNIPEPHEFAELKQPEPVDECLHPEDNPAFPQMIIRLGEVSLEINHSTPMDLLSRTLEVLKHAQ